MRARENPGRAPGASSEANSGAKFTAPSASLDEIAQNFEYSIIPRRAAGVAKITDLLYPDLLVRLIAAFFAPGGAWEDLLGQLIEFGDTTQLFSMPRDKRTEDYITGRFG